MKTDKLRKERRLTIVTLLEKYKSLSVDELSDHFYVTGSTIRTDLLLGGLKRQEKNRE
jgi:DeoR/GlpR family transcriptional regulator of sugar metabolism